MPLTILNLAGSVALLLWGVHMVQTGVQRAFGARLRSFLGRALKTRFSAFLAGTGVTALLQSSTATGLMVTGFAAGGLVDLVPALSVMLGANVGTTLIVQVLSFNVAAVAPAFVLVGVLMFRRATAGVRDFGRVLIGLGLVLMALFQLVSVLAPFEKLASLRLVLDAVSTQPVIAVILAAALTWAAHSSVAVVLVVMSLASKGTVSPEAAYALVLGANLGTAINPVLEGATGPDPAAKRLPLGNLVNRVIGVAVALALLPYLGALLARFEPNKAQRGRGLPHGVQYRALPWFSFRSCRSMPASLARWLPSRIDAADPGASSICRPQRPQGPGHRAGETPRAKPCAWPMWWRACWRALVKDALEKANRRQDYRNPAHGRRAGQAQHGDQALYHRHGSRKSSLRPTMTGCARILTFATNMEHTAGDIIDKNLLGIANQAGQAWTNLFAVWAGR